MKKTAVDYLIELMNMQGFLGVYCTEDKIDENRKLMAEIIKQAKAMEKQQIMQAVYDAMGTNFDPNMGRAEQYYKEKYGK